MKNNGKKGEYYPFHITGFNLINKEMLVLQKKHYQKGLNKEEQLIQEYLKQLRSKLVY